MPSPKFSLGALDALPGGEADVLVVSGTRIATLMPSRATWWERGQTQNLALPQIAVNGARWAERGDAILVGSGRIDIASVTWHPQPGIAALDVRPAPYDGRLVLKAAAWSADGKRAALLYGWSGPVTGARPVEQVRFWENGHVLATHEVSGAAGLLAVDDRVVIGAPAVRFFDFDGREQGQLAARGGAPVRMTAGNSKALLVDLNGSVRVVDVKTASVLSQWEGNFNDVAQVPMHEAFVGVSVEGRVRAGCWDGSTIRELESVESGIRDARIAVTTDHRLVLAGAGAVPVHVAKLQLDCSR